MWQVNLPNGFANDRRGLTDHGGQLLKGCEFEEHVNVKFLGLGAGVYSRGPGIFIFSL